MKSVWAAAVFAAALLGSACATHVVPVPSGPGAPFPGFDAAYEQATGDCRAVSTLTAALALSGRAGRTKLRGRIDAGFAAPASLRLEGVAPFGKPVFTLVSKGGDATLVLPRDNRVLRGAAPEAIVEALAGVPLTPARLRLVIAGCGLDLSAPSNPRAYQNGWAAAETGDATVFLRQLEGRWRVAASRRGSVAIDYADFESGRASTVRIRTAPPGGAAAADLKLRVSQLELNVPLDKAAFDVEVPRDAVPLTLDELRRAGPLGGGE
ncbi:MAG: hypothetical protein A3H96_22685 [Acidobacteria bacterium RIFCSPLOWO2_02_FULL_67_36]|nr:MAG: hypothetical protein A3H96_22685 [Acidobacteria bacterium RIFCSPLOWO2_02_FULL_67_36]OFW20943.1 MAG: hypothetical protein A3G21_23440 [Acidobacteria bacterium RIFCSPLOWO2_12_FULL_66_21]